MTILLILATALLPVGLLLAYIYKSDPFPEPGKMLFKAFAYGVGIVFPAVVIEEIISYALLSGLSPSLFTSAVKAFFVAALPEEALKLLALWLLLRKNPFFDEHIDGIVYAVYVSLGFAAVENIFYLVGNMDSWLTVGIARALLAVPGHYAFGVLMGFFYSLYYFVHRSRRNRILIFAAPFLAHGIYDTFAMMSDITPACGAIGFVCMVAFCIRLHKFCKNRIGSHRHRDEKLFGKTLFN
jgi:RsiW-degrading membrane proteinase PrsW (M82 family)